MDCLANFLDRVLGSRPVFYKNCMVRSQQFRCEAAETRQDGRPRKYFHRGAIVSRRMLYDNGQSGVETFALVVKRILSVSLPVVGNIVLFDADFFLTFKCFAEEARGRLAVRRIHATLDFDRQACNPSLEVPEPGVSRYLEAGGIDGQCFFDRSRSEKLIVYDPCDLQQRRRLRNFVEGFRILARRPADFKLPGHLMESGVPWGRRPSLPPSSD